MCKDDVYSLSCLLYIMFKLALKILAKFRSLAEIKVRFIGAIYALYEANSSLTVSVVGSISLA